MIGSCLLYSHCPEVAAVEDNLFTYSGILDERLGWKAALRRDVDVDVDVDICFGLRTSSEIDDCERELYCLDDDVSSPAVEAEADWARFLDLYLILFAFSPSFLARFGDSSVSK